MKQKILIIEDNIELNQSICEMLELKGYNTLSSFTGETGIELAIAQKPDAIVTDVMLPNMDGFEVVKKLKSNEATYTIPVIMLTALNDQMNKFTGLEIGADDYITKPFKSEEVVIRLANLIKNKERILNSVKLTKFFGKEMILSSDQEQFIQKLNETLENNIQNKALNVVLLSKEMGISVSGIERKCKEFLNKKPVDIIKEFRLQKAELLINSGWKSLTDVAFESGFNSLSYFSKCYIEHFGILPSKKTGRRLNN